MPIILGGRLPYIHEVQRPFTFRLSRYPYDNGNTYNEEVFMAIAINKWIDEAIGAKPTNIFEELKITNLSNVSIICCRYAA